MPIYNLVYWIQTTPTPINPWQPWANTVLYYSFDNDTASTSYDGAGSENWSWYNDSWTYQDVTIGKCCSLWWASKYMTIPQPFTYPTDNFTFSMWLAYTDYSSNQSRAIFSKWNGGSSSSWAYLMIYQYKGKICGDVPYASGNLFLTWDLHDAYGATTWHNVVMTRSGTSWKTYVDWNSTPVTTTTGNYTLDWTTYWAYIGTNNNSTGVERVGYNWLLDEFIIENVVWSWQDVSDYYNLTKSMYWIS